MICSNCGADNRTSAKFCAKCAQQLVPLWPATVQLEDDPPPRKRRRRSSDTTAPTRTPRGPRLGLYLVAGALLAALAAWALYSIFASPSSEHQGPQPPVAAASAPASAPPVGASAAGASAPPPVSAPAIAAQPPTTPPPVVHAEPAPRSRPAPSPSRISAPRATQVAPPAAAPVTAPEPVASAPVAAASRPAPRPETRALCADSSFLAHAVCLQTECARTGMRQHPQCQRMREQQQALREGSGDR
jgi:hypothetical protein